MKIANSTGYKTEDIRSLVRQCVVVAPVSLSSKYSLYVEVSPAKGKRTSAEALLGPGSIRTGVVGYYISLQIPKSLSRKRNRVLAWIIIHELFHCAGMSHKDMQDMFYLGNNGVPPHVSRLDRLSWAEKISLRAINPKVEESAEEKYERLKIHAEQMVERHKLRSEKESTLLAKWRRKLRYYKKKLRAVIECHVK